MIDIDTTFPANLLYKVSKIIKQNSLILPTESTACLSRLNFYKYGQFPKAKNSWENYLKKLSENLNTLSLS